MYKARPYVLVIVAASLASTLFAKLVTIVGGFILNLRLDNSLTFNESVLVFVAPILGAVFVTTILSQITGKRPRYLHGVIFALKGRSSNPSFWGDSVISAFSSFANLALGISLGRFSPCVQMGIAIGDYIGTTFDAEPTEITTLCCTGVAAAVSACVGTPMAALMFVVETMRDMTRVRICWVMAACIFAFSTARILGAALPFSNHNQYPSVVAFSSVSDVFLSATIGAVCVGCAGALHTLYAYSPLILSPLASMAGLRRFNALPLLGGLCLIVLIWVMPDVAGTSDAVVHRILGQSAPEPGFCVLFALCKLLATALCISCGFQGGVIGPCVVVGACLAHACATLASAISPDIIIDAHVVAAAGAAAMIAATLKLPLFAVAFGCELFGATNGAVVVLLSTVIAYFLSRVSPDIYVPAPSGLPTSAHIDS
jgi:CIC family chloride channel protein